MRRGMHPLALFAIIVGALLTVVVIVGVASAQSEYQRTNARVQDTLHSGPYAN